MKRNKIKELLNNKKIFKSYFSVYHFKNEENNLLLSKYIQNKLNLELNYVLNLISLGSVYYCSKLNKDPKRILNDIEIYKDDYIRVYSDTSRYNVEIIQWNEKIIYNCDDFVVVNKPSGISCNPTVGNFHENVSECIRKYLNLEKIYLPHRLDSDTNGLFILGKTLSFTRNFPKISFQKKYKTLVTWRGNDNNENDQNNQNNESSPYLPPIGTILTHYMENSKVQPKFLHHDQFEDSKICQSIVVNRSKVISHTISEWNIIINQLKESNQEQLSNALFDWVHPYDNVFDFYRATKHEKYLDPAIKFPHNSPLYHNERIYFCEIELELITGRTHQLRAQIQALGNGIQIAGDKLYHTLLPGALISPTHRKLLHPQFVSSPHLALQSYSIKSNDFNFELPSAFWTPLFSTDSLS